MMLYNPTPSMLSINSLHSERTPTGVNPRFGLILQSSFLVCLLIINEPFHQHLYHHQMTYFVSLNYTNYSMVTDWYVAGNEIADHTVNRFDHHFFHFWHRLYLLTFWIARHTR